jgi:hypothetical protein
MHALLITRDQRGNKENDPLAGQGLKERRVEMQARKPKWMAHASRTKRNALYRPSERTEM